MNAESQVGQVHSVRYEHHAPYSLLRRLNQSGKVERLHERRLAERTCWTKWVKIPHMDRILLAAVLIRQEKKIHPSIAIDRYSYMRLRLFLLTLWIDLILIHFLFQPRP